MFSKYLATSARRLLGSAPACLLLALAACGGSDMSSVLATGSSGGGSMTQGCTASSCGTALISLMDANGDFDSYTVDVTALSLTRADGTVVQTLPMTTRVDFTQLVALKELLTAATVPNGAYVSGTLTLDYTNADIEVDVNGMPTKAAVIDAAGNPVTTLALSIQFDTLHRLIIAPGIPALLDLDFDLQASNTVNLATSPVQVTVQPFIVASLQPTDNRPALVRGQLASVDSANSDYVVDVLPFALMSGKFGNVTVHTTATTHYEIDGTTYTGAAGLTALAALPAGDAVSAYGTFSTTDRSFTASIVHAGTSVEGTLLAALGGTVIARSANELTVRGATLTRITGSFEFVRSDTVVTVGSGTKVTADGMPGSSLGIAAVSVGQHIEAFGTASTAGLGVTFDATAGRVRMEVTPVAGLVTATAGGMLTLNVQSIDRRDVSVFNFAGTGTSSAQDANPAQYSIATGSLSLAGLTLNSPAAVLGFVAPFGSSPPDFQAQSVANFSATAAALWISWGRAGTATPFSADSASGIVIDTTNMSLGAAHYIRTGPLVSDITTLSVPPVIVNNPSKPGVFAIGRPGNVQIFNDFAAFTAALGMRLSAGDPIIALQAIGSFNATTSTFTSEEILVEFASSN